MTIRTDPDTGAKPVPVVDWSEFHIWSPNGVFKLILRGKAGGGVDAACDSSANLLQSSKGELRATLVACGVCVQQTFNSAVGLVKGQKQQTVISDDKTAKVGVSQSPGEKSVGSDRVTVQHDVHTHKHHGLVEEAYFHLFAGALGGSTATYLTHWLDTVKVKMQTLPGAYTGGRACLVETYRSDGGVRGLYKGAVPAVMGQALKTAVVFVSYGLCEEVVRRATGCEHTQDLTVWHHAGAGAMTGVVASFILCPLELLKCRQQTISQIMPSVHTAPPAASTTRGVRGHGQAQGQTIIRTMTSFQMARHVLKRQGLPGLYRGLPGIWVKEVPGSFIYFGSYEFAKYMMRTLSEKEHISRRAVFLCGMYAGLCFCITHPIESVKTRVQVMSAISPTKGFLRMFVDIIRTEGVFPLCSGLGPSMVRACLYSGIQFLTYETVKDFLLND